MQTNSNVIDFKAALKSRANRTEAGSGSYNRARAKAAEMGIALAPVSNLGQQVRDFRARLRASIWGGEAALEAECQRQRLRDAAG